MAEATGGTSPTAAAAAGTSKAAVVASTVAAAMEGTSSMADTEEGAGTARPQRYPFLGTMHARCRRPALHAW